VTEVDCAPRCIVSWAVVWERTWDALQETIERAAPAQQYYSDACLTYETLVYYPGHHAVAPGKSQTYRVEAATAELRHYLARLGRRSRCFSRSIHALRRAVKLFVHAWNRRQLHKRAFPRYASHVRDFVCQHS
jgi:IS1 family transposase